MLSCLWGLRITGNPSRGYKMREENKIPKRRHYNKELGLKLLSFLKKKIYWLIGALLAGIVALIITIEAGPNIVLAKPTKNYIYFKYNTENKYKNGSIVNIYYITMALGLENKSFIPGTIESMVLKPFNPDIEGELKSDAVYYKEGPLWHKWFYKAPKALDINIKYIDINHKKHINDYEDEFRPLFQVIIIDNKKRKITFPNDIIIEINKKQSLLRLKIKEYPEPGLFNREYGKDND
jgi:hypothetical protein